MSRFLNAELNNEVVSVYDKTKTTIAGRVSQKTIGGKLVLGPPHTKFIDVFTDSIAGLTLAGPMHLTANGRLFATTAITAGVASLLLYDFNLLTGQTTYVGRQLITFPNAPATTHGIRYIRAYDGANSAVVTGWKVAVGTVGAGTNAIVNSGLFLANNLDKSQFAQVSPPQVFFALSNNIRAVYHLQDPAGLGQANNRTTLIGGALNGQEIVDATGSAASLQHFGFDLSIAPTVNVLTVTNPGGVTFTATAHGYANNDPVVLTTTGTIFGGFTASNQTSLQTVYFARNVTANTFELSATFGGAAISASTAGVGTQSIQRAFGSTTALHLASRKTGVITTGFAGTALLTDSHKIEVVQGGPRAGELCYIIATTTNFYAYRLTDIVSGATTLPSAASLNVLGNGTDIVAPTATFAQYSSVLGVFVYTVANFSFMTKRWTNSQILQQFGGQVNTWLENTGRVTDFFGGVGIVGLEIQNGWVLVSMTQAGQRGIFALDLRSDTEFDYSYVISKVLFMGEGQGKYLATIEELFDITDTLTICYKTAATASDPIFDNPATGWTLLSIAQDLSSFVFNKYVQFKVNYDIGTLLSATPTQLHDLLLGYTRAGDNSVHWNFDGENSTKSLDSPGRTAAILIQAYDSGTVPPLKMTAKSRATNTVVREKFTVADAAEFEKSTDSGTSWGVLGTIPNTINTTRIRYNWGSPIPEDVDIIWSEA